MPQFSGSNSTRVGFNVEHSTPRVKLGSSIELELDARGRIPPDDIELVLS